MFAIYFFLKYYIKKYHPSKPKTVVKEESKKLNEQSSDTATPNGIKKD
jgi:hypothetical protein